MFYRRFGQLGIVPLAPFVILATLLALALSAAAAQARPAPPGLPSVLGKKRQATFGEGKTAIPGVYSPRPHNCLTHKLGVAEPALQLDAKIKWAYWNAEEAFGRGAIPGEEIDVRNDARSLFYDPLDRLPGSGDGLSAGRPMSHRSRRLPAVLIALLLVGAATLTLAGPAASETLPLPTAKTEPPLSVGPRGALLGGSINPNGRVVSYWIAFGRKRPSEHHTRLSEEEFVGHEPLEVEEFAQQLPEGTVYHYRLVVLWNHGTKMAYGGERAFRTKCWVGSGADARVAPCRRRSRASGTV